jgi:predicted transcriptional regulator
MRTTVFTFRVTDADRRALGAIAERLERSPADVLRRLIRAEARRRRIALETTDGGA